jgi:prepilin-type N-terminal cleavage/methylation domain-containing protein
VRRRAGGFTLVELMVVVTIISVLGSVAVVSMRRGRTEGDADAWANSLRNVMLQARRRAAATKTPYLVEIKQNQVQWCQVSTNIYANSSTAAATVCAGTPSCAAPPAGAEVGRPIFTGADAMTDSVLNKADVGALTGSYSASTHAALGSSATAQLFFGANGSADASCANVVGNVTGLLGYTVYVRGSNVVASSTAASQKRRRVILYGATGRARILDTW